MRIDLHGFELLTAKSEILLTLEEMQGSDDFELELVHGFHEGQVLKTYLRSGKFISDMAKEGFSLNFERSSNPGITNFKIFSSE